MRLVEAAAIRFQMMMPMLVYGNLTNAFLLVTSLYCMQVQGHRVSQKWFSPLLRESKFGQPKVVQICKELILQAKSTTREAGKAGLHERKSEGLQPLRRFPKIF